MGERIVICTAQVPFLSGGAELHTLNLKKALEEYGHQAEIVALPFKWYPSRTDLARSMLLWRLLDLTHANGTPIDRVIAMKFPAYAVRHPNKIAWIIHQHRGVYDLWDAQISDVRQWPDGEATRQMIHRADRQFLQECRRLFANSATVAHRLHHYNGLTAEPLYHPPPEAHLLRQGEYGEYIFCPSRLDPLKRQSMLLHAMAHTRTQVRCIVAGHGPCEGELRALAAALKLQDRVQFVGFVPTAEKVALYADALAVFFGPIQEDYGYITLEAFASAKAVLTCADSGGPLEFVRDGETGYVVEYGAHRELAARLDELYTNRALAKRLGDNACESYRRLHLSWHTVVERLLA